MTGRPFPGRLCRGRHGIGHSVVRRVRAGDAAEHHEVAHGVAADAVAAVHAAGGLARGEFIRYLVIVLFDLLARCEKGQNPVAFIAPKSIIDPLVSLVFVRPKRVL